MTRAAESTTPDIDVVAINDPGLSAPYMAYLLQHDSVMGRFGGEVHAAGDDLLLIDGRPVVVSRESDPAAVLWSEAGASTSWTRVENSSQQKQQERTWAAP